MYFYCIGCHCYTWFISVSPTRALFISLPVTMGLVSLVCIAGLVIFATYQHCDPYIDGRIISRDQVTVCLRMRTMWLTLGVIYQLLLISMQFVCLFSNIFISYISFSCPLMFSNIFLVIHDTVHIHFLMGVKVIMYVMLRSTNNT